MNGKLKDSNVDFLFKADCKFLWLTNLLNAERSKVCFLIKRIDKTKFLKFFNRPVKQII